GVHCFPSFRFCRIAALLHRCGYFFCVTPLAAHNGKSKARRPAPTPCAPRVSASVACHVAGFLTGEPSPYVTVTFHCADACPHIENASTRMVYWPVGGGFRKTMFSWRRPSMMQFELESKSR